MMLALPAAAVCGMPSEARLVHAAKCGMPSEARLVACVSCGMPSEARLAHATKCGMPSEARLAHAAKCGMPSEARLAHAAKCGMPSEARRARRKRRVPKAPLRTKSRASTRRLSLTIEDLALRHALLHDFLVETGSERPAFVDSRVVDAGALRIGPTTVDVDFLGAPIVRARITNPGDRDIDALVVVTVEGAHGDSARASAWIERLGPRAERPIELDCPNELSPIGVRWSVTPL